MRKPTDSLGLAGADADTYMAKFLHRTTLLLGADAVRTLATKTVAIAGCGGVGGAVAITLARMGVGAFVLADPGIFDEPDANRQWAANRTVLGRNKAEVYGEVLHSINPTVCIHRFAEGVTLANVDAFLNGAHVVIDCLDVGVTSRLRTKVYRAARANGAHCLTAPMLGFGAVVAIGAPDGMPLEAVFGRSVEAAATCSKLPPGLREYIVPEHLATVERHVGSHRVPSVAISPVLSTAIISTEVYLLLLGAGAPGWRPPNVLPEVFVVDPIRMTYRVVPIQALLKPSRGAASRPAAQNNGRSPDAALESGADADAALRQRQAVLESVGRNTLLVPMDAITVDLLSDSWRERSMPARDTEDSRDLEGRLGAHANLPGAHRSHGDVAGLIGGLYGYGHTVSVFRGRFAEALLVQATIRPGRAVLTNALFPTTRHHLSAAGANVVELGLAEADDPFDPHPFKGELDLEALSRALASNGGKGVQAVYIELCVNAIGGHPIRLSHLRAVRDLAAARGVPVLLDASRAFANAALLREREPGQADRPLASIVRDLCACSTACASSLTKDFVTPVGGFIGTNDAAMFGRLRDLAMLAYGDGLGDDDRAALAAALSSGANDESASTRRDTVRRLHAALTARSIPVAGPPGGHAVYVDAVAFLPHLGADDHRTTALANALYVAGGVRAGKNLGTPRQAARGVELLRLAVPVGGLSEADVERVVEVFLQVNVERAGIEGLRRGEGTGGMVGELMGGYAPA